MSNSFTSYTDPEIDANPDTDTDDDDLDPDPYGDIPFSASNGEPVLLSDTEITEAEQNTNIIRKTYLFFSHQNRTKMYVIDSFNQLSPTKINTKIRFSNGSILCLTMLKKSNVCHLKLDLLYTGDSSSNKKPKRDFKKFYMSKKKYKYWVKEGEIIPNNAPDFEAVNFTPITTTCNFDELQNVFKIHENDLIEGELNYCVFNRHGQALHNAKKWNTTYNTSLTDLGQNQAYIAGQKFSNIMNELNIIEINTISASDLIRTHQTCANFLTGLVNTRGFGCLEDIKQLFIIPCFHEIERNMKDGDYGINRSLSSLGVSIQNENKTNCTESTCKEISVDGKVIPIDWNFYANFYGNFFRGQKGNNRELCRNNHFLGLFFDLLQEIKNPVNQGQIIEMGGKKSKSRTHKSFNKSKRRKSFNKLKTRKSSKKYKTKKRRY